MSKIPTAFARRRTATTLIAAALLAAVLSAPMSRSAVAADQLKVVVGFAAGSGVDAIARLVADRVRTATGMTIIVDNRPGGGGRVAAEVVAHSDPDGSTILFAPIVTTAFTPFVFKKLNFDPLKDLAPITRVGNFKFTLAVNNDVPANTVQEFVAYVKANPGKVSYATPGPGTPAHFLGAMFNKATGTDLLHVPYRGSGPAAVAILGGQVQSAFNTTVAMGPLYKGKKVKLLAVTGSKRSPTLADVPTFGELKMNLGDIENAELWYGFLAQGKTPPATIQKLNAQLIEALKDATVQARLQTLDIEVATDTPEAFAKLIQADYERWGRVIKASGFTLSD
ncbi:MAG: tripartite tricarboxylate transporter substrate binding protein [Rhizobiales bacterium]|nr:tripartite tricarboxylate transporter substrate binding protein [Hyphomicrobiales bacterium]